ncbi:RagB/SusD family nutrient uptake outer membrane protein [Flammeovirga agarivorans]|uniref:RagB/SusD family nutrient uptake outer membrane protein n=1 Tax=Flammeovirga agarivorans TaxID=2726742 RepID=A0A7X8SHS4_9BACT|nr:RagB/SusD family nutrient uptake outer membrane protein [Flammeovirga agarivorans]NLR90382.1 RagB/SusD family nutrient uptake outer membrane protein [Flammeovirga agarivorans]
MNFKSIKKYIAVASIAVTAGFTSCVHQLDTVPVDPNVDTKDKVYQSVEDYNQGLAKLYAGYAVTGQQGPDGNGDLGGIDEGASQYLRRYWEAQELPTDEAINCWGDPGQPDMSTMTWSTNNTLNEALYYRIIYQISLANQFLRDAADSGFDLTRQRAEARFLRAYSYWHALDLYGNGVPKVTEENSVGSDLPEPWGAQEGRELFDYLVAELKSILDDANDEHLVDIGSSMFGQANKGVAHMLLAKLYLNAEVYIGEPHWEDAKKYTDLVVNNYMISDSEKNAVSAYQSLFVMDNYEEYNEIIFSINYFGNQTRTWGGMTYLINAATGGDMDRDMMGAPGWGGNRSMTSLQKYFDGATDERSLFFVHTDDNGNELTEIVDFTQFVQGVQVTKFRNVDSKGNPGDATFAETNFPVFRVADALLMQTEIEWRMYGSAKNDNIRLLWERAGRPTSAVPTVSAEVLLAERARELYWEGHRRQDLRRFNTFTKGTVVPTWPYKGAQTAPGGLTTVAETYEVYPIPSSEIGANPNLTQNKGY